MNAQKSDSQEIPTQEEEAAVTKQPAMKRLAYRMFVSYVSLNALAVLIAYYLLPLPQPVREVLVIMDGLNAVIFFFDFIARFVTSKHRMRYFFLDWGWLDLLGSLPFYPLLRLLRIVRSIRDWRSLIKTTPTEMRLAARRQLAESGLFLTASLVLLMITVSSVALAAIEPEAPGANILTGGDAVWFVFMTVATVGYGDVVPATEAGRAIGVMLMIVGVSAFSVLTSFIASTFVARRPAERDDSLVKQ